jgi:hypothetical protein
MGHGWILHVVLMMWTMLSCLVITGCSPHTSDGSQKKEPPNWLLSTEEARLALVEALNSDEDNQGSEVAKLVSEARPSYTKGMPDLLGLGPAQCDMRLAMFTVEAPHWQATGDQAIGDPQGYWKGTFEKQADGRWKAVMEFFRIEILRH